MGPGGGASSVLALLLSSLWGAVLLVAGAGTVEATTADIGGGVFTSVTGVHDEGHGFRHAVDGHFGSGAIRGRFNAGEVRGGTPGQFNLYILAMSWKPEWCYHSPFPGCKAPRDFWEDNLTIHGLWPDYGDGKYPTTCTSEAYDHDRVVNAIGIDVLETMWPNVQVPEDAGKKYDSFWMHEWAKHGTCTGLSQEEYFSATVSLLKTRFVTPSQLTENVGGSTTRAELESAYGGEGMAVLNCQANVHLNQVSVCLEKDSETGLPGKQIACPEAVAAHGDNCPKGALEIASF